MRTKSPANAHVCGLFQQIIFDEKDSTSRGIAQKNCQVSSFLYILLTMDEKSQIIYMQTRLTRLAAEQWKMSLLQAASLFEEKGVYHYIAKMWDLFHVEGDLAVLDDIKQYLDAKEVACG